MSPRDPSDAAALERQRVRANVLAKLFGEDPEPVRVGRFEITKRLGSGATGVVYKAYDPELARHIAIKILHAGHVRRGRERFLREARALAKLSNPNIISIYDVGDLGGTVFIATELIEGVTLREWLEAEDRAPAEIVRVFGAAGTGLASAHRAGIVHRDFKPANVMIGQDQRVCVVDFGLARADRDAEDPAPTHSVEPVSATMTATGTALGTPIYMAPEQRRGEAGPSSDQFSFCVALYEALYGKRPFDGDTVDSLAAAIEHGPAPIETGTGVPAHLEAVIARGLEPEPSRRFDTMDELLSALRRDPVRARRRVMFGGVAVLAVFGLGVVAATSMRGQSKSWETRCAEAAESERAALWNPSRAARLQRGFAASGHHRHAALFASTTSAIDRYADRWKRAHNTACRDTRVRGSQSEKVLDLRMACLRQHRSRATALLDLLESPDKTLAVRAPRTLARLGATSDCSDVSWLLGKVKVPSRPKDRAALTELRAELDQVHALIAVGRFKQALARVEPIVAAAEKLGHPPLYAEAFYKLADLRETMGDTKAGAKLMRQLIPIASEAGDDRLVARAWEQLMWIIGYRQGNRKGVSDVRLSAEAALRRAGDPPDLRAAFEYTNGWLYYEDRKLDQAERSARRALQLWRTTRSPDDASIFLAMKLIAVVAHSRGDYRGALAQYQSVLSSLTRVFGETDPRVATTLTNIGLTHADLDDAEQAVKAHRRALAIASAHYPTDSPRLVVFMINLAGALAEVNEHAEAMAIANRALSIRESNSGKNHISVAHVLNTLSGVSQSKGDFVAAEGYNRRAMKIRENALGKEHFDVGVSAANLAEALVGQKRFGQAEASARRARAIFERALGKEHPYVAITLTHSGNALLGLRRYAEATSAFERAVAIRTKNKAPASAMSAARFGLARALWASPAKRKRAVAEAEKARDEIAGAGARHADQLREIQRWLALRR